MQWSRVINTLCVKGISEVWFMTWHEKWTHIHPLNNLQMVKRAEVGVVGTRLSLDIRLALCRTAQEMPCTV